MDIRTALEAEKPTLRAYYNDLIIRLFNGMVQRHGPKLKGIYNSHDVRTYRGSVQHLITWTNVERGCLSKDSEATLDPVKLAAAANRYADETVELWIGKIQGKVGGLTDAEIKRLARVSYCITGKRGDRKVLIHQSCIVNVSSKGTVFNQFPARIYVDGKFTSEANYKKF